jgi:hypothetical protein
MGKGETVQNPTKTRKVYRLKARKLGYYDGKERVTGFEPVISTLGKSHVATTPNPLVASVRFHDC